jgi:hypothetical protein
MFTVAGGKAMLDAFTLLAVRLLCAVVFTDVGSKPVLSLLV